MAKRCKNCGHKAKWHDSEAGCLKGVWGGGKACPCAKYEPAVEYDPGTYRCNCALEPTPEYDFDFCVSGLSKEQAQTLLDLIVDAVVMGGGHVGGGFHEVTE